MLLRSGNVEVIGAGAWSKDECVVLQRSGGQHQAPVGRIHRLNHIAAELESAFPPNLTDGLNNVARVGITRGDLRQERGEQQVILLTDEENFGIAVTAEEAIETGDRLQPAETRSDHDDALHGGTQLAHRSRGARY